MNWDIVLKHIFGSLQLEFVVAFYFFAIMGMTFTLLTHLVRKKVTSVKKKTTLKFSFGFWLKDNLVRMLTNIIVIFLILRFYDKLNIDKELDMFLGLIIGSSIDVIIIMVRNKTNINIFQAKNK